MNMWSASPAERTVNAQVAQRLPLYQPNMANLCPGCGKSHWLVGRVMAQCAFCETAMPLAHGWRLEGLAPD
ncbi:MAG: hypothetical protein V4533_14470 [Pseudomonadota bacterium]